MGKSLVVVESPSKARTIKKYLGRDFDVQATVGHLKDLPPREMGVDVEKEFELDYQVIRGKGKVVQNLRKSASGCDHVFIGSDPDREGEAIAWHVAEELGGGKNAPEISRVLFHEITKRGVAQAMEQPQPLNKPRYESQKARRAMDRLVGYEISPLLWKKVRRGLSAGRVQSVAVSLVVDREREIQAFDTREYWTIKALLAGPKPPEFMTSLVEIDGKKVALDSREVTEPVVRDLEAATWVVESVDSKTRRQSPLPPFITSKLQQDAHRYYRYTAKRTMALAQQLYEGVELGSEGPTGLITYMRTDSTRVSMDSINEVRGHIEREFGKDYVPGKPNFYQNRKAAQDAHEAIRPTSVSWTPERIRPYLDTDQWKLYSLIWKRFVASQMTPAVFAVTQVSVLAGGRYRLKASGQVQQFAGYRRIYQELSNGDKPEDTDLPPLKKGQELALQKLDWKQNFTQPPARYTEATLIKLLEELGIGRPSTYANILSTIQDRKYVIKDSGRFAPSELGFAVTDLLRGSFAEILNVGFTAQMEEALDQIEEGGRSSVDLLQGFWTRFSAELGQARTGMKDLKSDPILSGVTCDLCEQEMAIKFGKNGEFLACTGFPDCRNTRNFARDEKGQIVPEERQGTGQHCPEHKEELVMRNGRFGPFLACPLFPKCKYTTVVPTGLPCARPGCKGELVERKSKKGKTFYRCSTSPECDFVMFGKPVRRACPDCDNTYLEEVIRRKRRSVSCPNPDCGHREE